MQKAGTGWLFDQLQHHPDFWMPPIKEFHYFDRDFPDKKLARTIADAGSSLEQLEKKRRKMDWRPLDERDLGFFRDAEAGKGKQRDLPNYAGLFRYKGDRLSGDITPAYCGLSDELIARITEYLPDLKVVLLIRDPIARAWSQISMSYRRGKFNSAWADDPLEVGAFLEMPAVQLRSFPTRIHERWHKYVPEDRLKLYFFDDIESEPDNVRDQVLSFLGADPAKESGKLEASFNRKSDLVKLEMTDVARDALRQHFADEVNRCASQFGGPAKKWVMRYGL